MYQSWEILCVSYINAKFYCICLSACFKYLILKSMTFFSLSYIHVLQKVTNNSASTNAISLNNFGTRSWIIEIITKKSFFSFFSVHRGWGVHRIFAFLFSFSTNNIRGKGFTPHKNDRGVGWGKNLPPPTSVTGYEGHTMNLKSFEL